MQRANERALIVCSIMAYLGCRVRVLVGGKRRLTQRAHTYKNSLGAASSRSLLAGCRKTAVRAQKQVVGAGPTKQLSDFLQRHPVYGICTSARFEPAGVEFFLADAHPRSFAVGGRIRCTRTEGVTQIVLRPRSAPNVTGYRHVRRVAGDIGHGVGYANLVAALKTLVAQSAEADHAS